MVVTFRVNFFAEGLVKLAVVKNVANGISANEYSGCGAL